jgi:hypothetical protein
VKVRGLLWLTAIVSSILGAIVVYLVLTVPNDLKAGSLLKTARADLAAGKSREAQESLATIVEQYPRTDAAAAATVALMKLNAEQRNNLQREVDALRTQNAQHSKQLGDMQKSIAAIKSTPPPAPVTVQAPAPAAKPTVKKSTPKKKTTPKKRTTTKRRR